MSVSVLTNALVIVNGVTLSDHGNQVTVEDMRDKVDISGFGTANKMYQKGLGDALITIKFLQDFAASSVHATIQPLIASTTGVAVEVRAVNAARSATNPAFLLASALVFDYKGLDAQLGNASEVTVIFENAGSAGMTYPIA